jgi:hypothetical protein
MGRDSMASANNRPKCLNPRGLLLKSLILPFAEAGIGCRALRNLWACRLGENQCNPSLKGPCVYGSHSRLRDNVRKRLPDVMYRFPPCLRQYNENQLSQAPTGLPVYRKHRRFPGKALKRLPDLKDRFSPCMRQYNKNRLSQAPQG